jgi:hypothetical protein
VSFKNAFDNIGCQKGTFEDPADGSFRHSGVPCQCPLIECLALQHRLVPAMRSRESFQQCRFCLGNRFDRGVRRHDDVHDSTVSFQLHLDRQRDQVAGVGRWLVGDWLSTVREQPAEFVSVDRHLDLIFAETSAPTPADIPTATFNM